MILEFKKMIPVVTPLGDGYALYVTSGGGYENDEWCVALCKGGQVRHFTSADIRIYFNATYGIGQPTAPLVAPAATADRERRPVPVAEFPPADLRKAVAEDLRDLQARQNLAHSHETGS
jgi:hypothetical protein